MLENQWKADEFYHVYNRGNNKCDIFFSDRNYQHFLHLLAKYLKEYIQIYAYCLMPNHFHLFLKILKIEEDTLDKTISNQFRLLFMSYTKAINKERSRTGSLFQKGYKKTRVDNDDYFTSLIAYIHLNPVKAQLVSNCGDWRYSSYNGILGLNQTHLARNSVLNWFGGKHGFIQFHSSCKEINLPSL